MPKLKHTPPAYRLHKASGNAVVTVDGRDVYLGKHGLARSFAEYERVIGERRAHTIAARIGSISAVITIDA